MNWSVWRHDRLKAGFGGTESRRCGLWRRWWTIIHRRRMRSDSGRERSSLVIFELLLDPGFGVFQPFFVGMKPSLVGVLQGSRQRRHDLPTVAQVSSNFSPFLVLAHSFEATSNLDRLFQFVQVERSLVDAGKPVQMSTVLLVEFRELIKIV